MIVLYAQAQAPGPVAAGNIMAERNICLPIVKSAEGPTIAG